MICPWGGKVISMENFVDFGNNYYLITIYPGQKLKILNDDQCTGTRVYKNLHATRLHRHITVYENQTETDIYALVDGERGFAGHGRVQVFSHIRDAVAARNGKNLMLYSGVKPFPRLRDACRRDNKYLVYVPGGEIPLHYGDELVVPNFSMSGTGWFVVPRAEISQLLTTATE